MVQKTYTRRPDQRYVWQTENLNDKMNSTNKTLPGNIMLEYLKQLYDHIILLYTVFPEICLWENIPATDGKEFSPVFDKYVQNTLTDCKKVKKKDRREGERKKTTQNLSCAVMTMQCTYVAQISDLSFGLLIDKPTKRRDIFVDSKFTTQL
jgi:hypothetical protein